METFKLNENNEMVLAVSNDKEQEKPKKTRKGFMSYLMSFGMGSSNKPTKYVIIGIPGEIDNKTEMHDKVATIPWITYREGFIPVDGWITDNGWGWMIRVAQMMLWNTLIRHIFNQFSIHCHEKYQMSNTEVMKSVLPLFLDDYK